MPRRKAASVREELERLREQNGGELVQPEQVIEFAQQNADSALHAEFEWDDTEAAHQYRLEQARRIIRLNINVVETENGNVRVPMYVSLVSDRKTGGGYRTLSDVMSDDDMREQFLDQALAEFQRVRRKYEAIRELVPVFEALDRVSRNASRRRNRRAVRA